MGQLHEQRSEGDLRGLGCTFGGGGLYPKRRSSADPRTELILFLTGKTALTWGKRGKPAGQNPSPCQLQASSRVPGAALPGCV